MKGIVLCVIFILAAACHISCAPVDTPQNETDTRNAVVAKSSAHVSKRTRIDPYSTIKSYIHPHRKRKHHHRRSHSSIKRLHRAGVNIPITNKVAYFGKGKKEILPAAKNRNLRGDRGDFEVNNGEIFEHGAVPDLRRNAVPPRDGKRALTVHIGEKVSTALARNAARKTEVKHTTRSARLKEIRDEDNNANNDSEDVAGSGFDETHNITLDKQSNQSAVTKTREDGNILLSKHVVFVLSNGSQMDNSSDSRSYQNISNSVNKTEPKFLTLSRFFGSDGKNNQTSLENTTAFSDNNSSSDAENLNNLHNLIKDLVSLDKSIYLVEHTLNMHKGHNKSNYKQFELNRNNYQTDKRLEQANALLSALGGNSSKSDEQVLGLNNNTMDEVHQNIENLVLRCLGFGSKDKSNNSILDSDMASEVHTSTGKLLLSCSDFDISKDQVSLLNPTSSLHLNFGVSNDTMVTHERVPQEHNVNKEIKAHNLAEESQGHSFTGKMQAKKFKNVKTVSVDKNRPKQLDLRNITKLMNEGENKTQVVNTHKSVKPTISSNNLDMEEKIKQDMFDNSTIALFKNYGLHDGTDPRLRELINDVINLDNTTTYYYSYSSEGDRPKNESKAKAKPTPYVDDIRHKHSSSKYLGNKRKGANNHDHKEDVVSHAVSTNPNGHEVDSQNDSSGTVFTENEDKPAVNISMASKNETKEQGEVGDLSSETNGTKPLEFDATTDNKTMTENIEEKIPTSDNSSLADKQVMEDKHEKQIHSNDGDLVSKMRSDGQPEKTVNASDTPSDMEENLIDKIENSTASLGQAKTNRSITNIKFTDANGNSIDDFSIAVNNKTENFTRDSDDNIDNSNTPAEEVTSGDAENVKDASAYSDGGNAIPDGYIIRSDEKRNATDNQTEVMYHDNDGYDQGSDNSSSSQPQNAELESKNTSNRITHGDDDVVLHDKFIKLTHQSDADQNKTTDSATENELLTNVTSKLTDALDDKVNETNDPNDGSLNHSIGSIGDVHPSHDSDSMALFESNNLHHGSSALYVNQDTQEQMHEKSNIKMYKSSGEMINKTAKVYNTKEGKGIQNTLSLLGNHKSGNDKRKENTVFQDYFMNSDGNNVAISNVTMPPKERGIRFFKNATSVDDTSATYDHVARKKKEYGTGILISQLVKSKIAIYKPKNNDKLKVHKG